MPDLKEEQSTNLRPFHSHSVLWDSQALKSLSRPLDGMSSQRKAIRSKRARPSTSNARGTSLQVVRGRIVQLEGKIRHENRTTYGGSFSDSASTEDCEGISAIGALLKMNEEDAYVPEMDGPLPITLYSTIPSPKSVRSTFWS